MVPILRATLVVDPDGLHVAPVVGRDTHLAPCGWDRERIDPGPFRSTDHPGIGTDVAEARATPSSDDRQRSNVDVYQPGPAGDLVRIDDAHDRHRAGDVFTDRRYPGAVDRKPADAAGQLGREKRVVTMTRLPVVSIET